MNDLGNLFSLYFAARRRLEEAKEEDRLHAWIDAENIKLWLQIQIGKEGENDDQRT